MDVFPCLAADRYAAQRTFGGIVGTANPPVIEEARERNPSLEHVVHGFGDVGMARELAAFGTHPDFEGVDKWRDAKLSQIYEGTNQLNRHNVYKNYFPGEDSYGD